MAKTVTLFWKSFSIFKNRQTTFGLKTAGTHTMDGKGLHWLHPPPKLSIQVLLTESLEIRLQVVVVLHGCVIEALGRLLLKGDLSVVVHAPLFLPLLLDVDTSRPQLSALLEGSQPPGIGGREQY